MNLALTEDIYIPTFEENVYKDHVPETQKIFQYKYPGGLKCECTIYDNREKFKRHINTKVHKKWLENLLKRALKAEAIVRQQQIIIAEMVLKNYRSVVGT